MKTSYTVNLSPRRRRVKPWLPDGGSPILRSYVFGPLGLKEYGSAALQKFDPFLSLNCARVDGGGRRKGRDQILLSGNLETERERERERERESRRRRRFLSPSLLDELAEGTGRANPGLCEAISAQARGEGDGGGVKNVSLNVLSTLLPTP